MKKIAILLFSLLLIPIVSVNALTETVKVDMHYIVVDPGEDNILSIQHMANYSNTGDEDYTGEGNQDGVLSISLPTGAFDLKIQDENLGTQVTKTGFTTSLPIAAQESQIISYSYQVPASVPVVFSLGYPLEVLQVLVPEGKGSLQFSESEVPGPQQIQIDNQTYWMYNVADVRPDMNIHFTYMKDTQPVAETVEGTTGTNGTSQGAVSSEQNSSSAVTRTAPEFHNPGHLRMWYQSPLKKFDPHILMIVLGVILVAGVSYYSFFRWKNRLQEQRLGLDKEETEFKQLVARQNAIMDKIIELEETNADGKLNEEEYLAKLSAYKQHLVQVKQNLSRFVE
jgi:hypothetical protein